MRIEKADILSQLQKDILLLEGFKPAGSGRNDAGLGIIEHAFPQSTFPLGAIHEFLCHNAEDCSSSSGFIAALLSSLMKCGSPSVWISPSKTVFPPALKQFKLDPHRIIFVEAKRPKEILWAVEEALKCDSLCAVIGEISEISFTESRRLQLAVEQTRVTGFLIRSNPKNLATSSVTKWIVKSIPGSKDSLVPGVSFPRWNVELVKVRNGKPGSWQMEWRKGKLHLVREASVARREEQRKIV